MKRLIILLAVLTLSGCICCGGADIPDMGGESGGGDDEGQCQRPYIQVGEECCLDADDNMICDADEEDEPDQTATTAKKATTTTAPPTTAAQKSTITAAPKLTTTIQPRFASTYQCVKDIKGQEVADGVLYFFSTRCGDGKSLATASTAQGRTGVKFYKVKIGGSLDDDTLALMECFYGDYSQGNREFSYCPRLLCPRNGKIKDLKGLSTASVMSQMTGFAKDC